MRQIKNFDDVNEVLNQFVPPPITTGAVLILDRMRSLMKFLGDPQDSYRVVHIAGTSGKTSTAYYITSLLNQAGQKVGLTVSPHVDQVNERLQINLEPLPEKTYVKEFEEFLNLIKKSGVEPTYFELLVAFAFWEFAKQKVDYAVIEVGLGGRLDATNVINLPDKVAVITDIGFDHIEALGDTLTKIATEKAGIIGERNPIFTHQQEVEVMTVIEKAARSNSTKLQKIGDYIAPDNLPLFQKRNWALAKTVFDFVAERDGLIKLSDQQIASSAQISVPARMEIIKHGGKTIILDGAHNTQKMSALVNSVHEAYPDEKIAAMVGFKFNKDFEPAVQQLLGIAEQLIITSFTKYQDMKHGSVPPETIAEYCKKVGYSNYEIINDPVKAYSTLLKRSEKVLLITGSFYLLNHIRPLIKKETK